MPGAAAGAAPKKPRRRGWIVAGVVAAVIVVAGAGFWVWHELCRNDGASVRSKGVESYYPSGVNFAFSLMSSG